MEAPRKRTPELLEAIDDLNRQGIPATDRAVANWIEEHKPTPARESQPSYEAPRAETGAPAQVAPFTPAELEGLAGASQPRPARRNLGGRPAREEPWLEEAAKLVASGGTLREALQSLGVPFTEQSLNNLQRRVRFRHYLEKHRQGP